MSMSWLRRGFLLSLLALASVALIACSSDDEDNTSANAADSAASGESTLEKVKDRGTLKCGISGSLPGFSQLEADTVNGGGYFVPEVNFPSSYRTV